MRFKVPKFLERETKIIGFLTFKQLTFVGGAGLVLLILYYILPRYAFFISLLIIGGLVFSFSFIRIEGISLGRIIIQSFGYFLGPKSYLWEKREISPTIKLLKKEKKVEKEKTEAPLKISPESRLGKLSSKIERGLR